MRHYIFTAISMTCVLAACSNTPPTAKAYVAQTNELETNLVMFIGDGYPRSSWGQIAEKALAHETLWHDVKDLPEVCHAAANALNAATIATALEWPYDKWREAYARYVDNQGKCEQAVFGKEYRRSLAPNLPTRQQIRDYWAAQPSTG